MNRSSEPKMARWSMTGRALVAVVVDVVRAQPAGKIQVDLPGAALPVAADGVLQDELELRSVESALALVQREFDAGCARRLLQRLFGAVPDVVIADPLRRAIGELHEHVVEAEIAINRQQQLDARGRSPRPAGPR